MLQIPFTFKDSLKIENSLDGVLEWESGVSYKIGSLVSYLGNVYYLYKEVESEDLKRYPPMLSCNYAMHPSSCVKIIHQICLFPSVDIVLKGNQVWVYFSKTEHKFDDHVVYGSHHYYRSAVHDLSGLNLAVAFNGLLIHRDLNLLELA